MLSTVEAPARPAPPTLSLRGAAVFARLRALAPGVAAALSASVAAALVANVTGAPPMLVALVCGVLLNPLFAGHAELTAGVSFCAKGLLRFGIVLLGARVTLADMAGLGPGPVFLAAGGVVATLCLGWLIGRLFGLKSDHAMLSAGAVAICGASAALAISSALPQRAESDRNTTVTVLGVTALSTVAMVLYPLIARALHLEPRAAGVFLGASIHDVAQVVAAGFMISPAVAATATIVKLMRVVCLAPVVAAIGWIFRAKARTGASIGFPVPLFVLGFLAVVLLRSSGAISAPEAGGMATASQWLLQVSVLALGAKTAFKDLLAPGAKPLLVLVLQTALLCVIALGGALFLL